MASEIAMARIVNVRLPGVLVLALTLAAGCATPDTTKRPDRGVAIQDAAIAKSAAYRDTIGALTYYEGLAAMRVRGYGVVVGLGKNGSRQCPKHIYDELVQNLYKQHDFAADEIGDRSIKPEELLDSLDSAVVGVEADIPGAAVEGTSFDVTVTALPGTETKSLYGGRLFTTELRVHSKSTTGGSLSGQVLAKAAGPLFLNPFVTKSSATRTSELNAAILGGGRATQDRRIRLVLVNPSHAMAGRIQDRINSAFPAGRRVADATSPSFVQLRVPEEFREEPGHFLSLVRALYMTADPAFTGARALELAAELPQPGAPQALIALAFEGLGRESLPMLADLYAHDQVDVRFYAAVAGLRIGDHIAADTMSAVADDPKTEFRFRAIRALGEARGMAGAAMTLRRLLHDSDSRVRIAAYEALRYRRDLAVESFAIGGDNFRIDLVPEAAPGPIYATRTGRRAIVLFGPSLDVRPPLLYRAPDGSFTMTADANDRQVTLMRTVTATGRVSPPIPGPLSLASLLRMLGEDAGTDYDGEITGLGIGYVGVVRALDALCRDGSIPLPFQLEEPNAAELFGPAQLPASRPESEL